MLAVYSPVIKSDPWSIFKSVMANPLIISVIVATPFAYFQIGVPGWLEKSLQYLSDTTLPLALICIGGTLSMAALRKSGNMALSASLMKMIWLPVIATLGAWLLGFRGPELGILFLYFGAPTAAASFVMARAAEGNHELAAAIIVITTLMAAVTTNIGILCCRRVVGSEIGGQLGPHRSDAATRQASSHMWACEYPQVWELACLR